MTRRWSALVIFVLLATATRAEARDIETGPAVPSGRGDDLGDDRGRAIECMASAIAYEAAREPIEGRQAVAEVILNRVRDPAFPKSVCGVVYAGSTRRTGCQFSFTCDGSLAHRMSLATMEAARTVAEAALDGRNPMRVFGATSYHADFISPYWAPSLVRIGQIGAHIFYRNPGAADWSPNPSPFIPHGESARASANPNVTPVAVTTPSASGASRVFQPWGLSVSSIAP